MLSEGRGTQRPGTGRLVRAMSGQDYPERVRVLAPLVTGAHWKQGRSSISEGSKGDAVTASDDRQLCAGMVIHRQGALSKAHCQWSAVGLMGGPVRTW